MHAGSIQHNSEKVQSEAHGVSTGPLRPFFLLGASLLALKHVS